MLGLVFRSVMSFTNGGERSPYKLPKFFFNFYLTLRRVETMQAERYEFPPLVVDTRAGSLHRDAQEIELRARTLAVAFMLSFPLLRGRT